MVIQSDPAASGGRNIGIPEGAGNNYNDATLGGPGQVSFSIKIPKTGRYSLWGSTIARDGSSDSFYVTINGSLLKEWHVSPASTTWNWSKITEVSLAAGLVNLAFRQREDGIKLDQLILTEDLTLFPGIQCGSDCSEIYPSGRSVALTAKPASGSRFAGWTGAGCSTGTIIITAPMTCTANFSKALMVNDEFEGFRLTVTKAGTGSGVVSAPGIDCGSDCTQSYPRSTSVVLIATPGNGSTFGGWRGAGCIAGTVAVNADTTCTAIFEGVKIPPDHIGIYRPASGEWFLDSNGNYAWETGVDVLVQTFSAIDSVPVVGDWDGSGDTQLGLFQPSTLRWHLDLNNNRAVDDCTIDACHGPFGAVSDIAIAGKWNSGRHRIGVFQPSTGRWHLDRNADGDFDSCKSDRCIQLRNFLPGDLPVVGDWSGEGRTQLGLYRPSTGEWFLDESGNRAWDGCRRDRCVEDFGSAGGLPVAGDWDGSGKSKIGVWRPSTGQWFLDLNGNGVWDGCSVDICVAGFGVLGDVPVVGKW
jgi:hypothetical protein